MCCMQKLAISCLKFMHVHAVLIAYSIICKRCRLAFVSMYFPTHTLATMTWICNKTVSLDLAFPKDLVALLDHSPLFRHATPTLPLNNTWSKVSPLSDLAHHRITTGQSSRMGIMVRGYLNHSTPPFRQ